MRVVKKNGLKEPFADSKIFVAVDKSAKRAGKELTEFQKRLLVDSVKSKIGEEVSVKDLHTIVESCLDNIDDEVAKSYRSYRDYKQCFVSVMDDVFNKSKSLLYGVDKENANYDSNLISTKNSLIRGYLTKELYKNFFMSKDELQATEEGMIYLNDSRDLIQNCLNCCLFDMGEVLRGGFEMAGIQYKEPSTVLSALQVIGDVTLSVSAQQFGGFSVPECDKILLPYVLKSVEKHRAEGIGYGVADVEKYVDEKVKEELRQGFQSLELKLNTVPSSRGDFAFTTLTFGEFTTKDKTERYWLIEICKTILNTRMKGHGKNNIPVVFPKLVYLYSQAQHDANEDQKDLFELAIKCSSKAQYPDYLSLDGEGYVCDIYKQTGKIISPMGKR